jgi:hypothetical protein
MPSKILACKVRAQMREESVVGEECAAVGGVPVLRNGQI